MSDIEFDPDVIGSLPARLLQRSGDVTGASTLPSPDAGAATADARSAISHLESLSASLVESVDGLAGALDGCVRLYDQADGISELLLEFHMEAML